MRIFSWTSSKVLFFFIEANMPSLDLLMKLVVLTPGFPCDAPIPSTIFQIYFLLFQADYFWRKCNLIYLVQNIFQGVFGIGNRIEIIVLFALFLLVTLAFSWLTGTHSAVHSAWQLTNSSVLHWYVQFCRSCKKQVDALGTVHTWTDFKSLSPFADAVYFIPRIRSFLSLVCFYNKYILYGLCCDSLYISYDTFNGECAESKAMLFQFTVTSCHSDCLNKICD